MADDCTAGGVVANGPATMFYHGSHTGLPWLDTPPHHFGLHKFWCPETLKEVKCSKWDTTLVASFCDNYAHRAHCKECLGHTRMPVGLACPTMWFHGTIVATEEGAPLHSFVAKAPYEPLTAPAVETRTPGAFCSNHVVVGPSQYKCLGHVF